MIHSQACIDDIEDLCQHEETSSKPSHAASRDSHASRTPSPRSGQALVIPGIDDPARGWGLAARRAREPVPAALRPLRGASAPGRRGRRGRCRGRRGRRGRRGGAAAGVQLRGDEGEGLLAVDALVALVDGRVVAVAAVRVGRVAVVLDLVATLAGEALFAGGELRRGVSSLTFP